MQKKRVLCFLMGLTVSVCGLIAVSLHTVQPAQAAEVKTGTGLAEHVLMANDQGWQYQYGCYGQFVGGTRATDCSGLIKSYFWWTGDKTNPNPALRSVPASSESMLSAASAKGRINLSDPKSIPRVHGLILYSPGHVGVYVGNNMEVDNRESGTNILYRSVIGGRYHWQYWLKIPQLKYPTTGFVTFNGDKYYYENGQYVVSTTRTIGGTVYSFDDSGAVTSETPKS
jgi:hypothetical protein